MKTKQTNLRTSAFLAGAIVTGTATAFGNSGNAEELLSYEDLGSGAELRNGLIQMNEVTTGRKILSNETTFKFNELTCGEGKCGEGKCGEDKEKAKEGKKKEKAETKAEKTDESKCGEGKCGEGKCGGDEKKKEKKEDKE